VVFLQLSVTFVQNTGDVADGFSPWLPFATSVSYDASDDTSFDNSTRSGYFDQLNDESVNRSDSTQANSCTSFNSQTWLDGPRFGNIQDGMTPEIAQRMIVDSSHLLDSGPFILGKSLCLDDSRFVAFADGTDETDSALVRLWATKLSYLGLHYHQHRLAIQEAVQRSNPACNTNLAEQFGVGNFDYECGADAKYVIFRLSGVGLGANVRGGASVGLMAALVGDRIAMFVSKGPEGSNFTKKWDLASCDRLDYQCIFMPTTPCTLMDDDLRNAYHMSKHESRMFLMKGGRAPSGHEDDKVIVCTLMFKPYSKVPVKGRKRLHEYAHKIVDGLAQNDKRIKLLRAAADEILADDNKREKYDYSSATHKVIHAMSIYFLRPNPMAALKLDSIHIEIVPQNFHAETSIGLPVRGSDKCFRESECLSFYQHMQVVDGIWGTHEASVDRDSPATVIFTTEATDLRKEQEKFAGNSTWQSTLKHRFSFVTNSKDVTPNTGKLKPRHQVQNSADDIMISSLSSLQAQLLPRISIGNCCSNFHDLLADFLYAGCGAASTNTFVCLQEYPDPRLRICCGWHENCKKERQRQIALLENQLI